MKLKKHSILFSVSALVFDIFFLPLAQHFFRAVATPCKRCNQLHMMETLKPMEQNGLKDIMYLRCQNDVHQILTKISEESASLTLYLRSSADAIGYLEQSLASSPEGVHQIISRERQRMTDVAE